KGPGPPAAFACRGPGPIRRESSGSCLLCGLAKRRQLRALGELLQRALLELGGALGGEAEPLADRGERLGLLAPGAEAEGQYLPLGFGQLGDRTVHDLLALVLPGRLLRRLGVGGEQVAQSGVAVLADLLVEADERRTLVAHLLDLLDGQARLGGELLERRLTAEAHGQLA